MVAFGTVEKRKFKLIETGEYVFTLQDVGESDGDFGTRMVWDFLVADRETPTDYFTQDDGKVRTLRFWTDPEVTLGSQQLEWIQALTGREFGLDSALPDGDELLSKRMLAYLNHYTPKRGKNAGVPREDIVKGSAKPFALNSKRNGTAKPSTAPATTANNADERVALLAEIKKQLRRAELAEVEAVEDWKMVNMDEMDVDDLRSGLQTIKDGIKAALDAD